MAFHLARVLILLLQHGKPCTTQEITVECIPKILLCGLPFILLKYSICIRTIVLFNFCSTTLICIMVLVFSITLQMLCNNNNNNNNNNTKTSIALPFPLMAQGRLTIKSLPEIKIGFLKLS